MTAFTFTDTLSLVITSCAGTSMVTVRNPTLTARSIPGIRMMRPGPRSPTSSPSRNTTRRSYSRTTLIELTTTSRNANPTNSKNGTSNVPMSRLPHGGQGEHERPCHVHRLVVEEDQPAHRECERAAHGQHAVAVHLDLGEQEAHAEEQQREPRDVHGQRREREEREHEEDRPGD